MRAHSGASSLAAYCAVLKITAERELIITLLIVIELAITFSNFERLFFKNVIFLILPLGGQGFLKRSN